MTPDDLDLPSKFKVFRNSQLEGLDWIHRNQSSIMAAMMPTGSGKTLGGVAAAKSMGVKSAYLVATKALEQQVMNDFEESGMVNVHGANNYKCPNQFNCGHGFDNDCSLYGTRACQYSRAVETARTQDMFVSNYAYWLASRSNKSDSLQLEDRPIEFLICDEAHTIETQITNFMSVDLPVKFTSRLKIEDTGFMDDEGHKQWDDWVNKRISVLSIRKDEKDIRELLKSYRKILRMSGNWVWQRDERGNIKFSPIHIWPYTKHLFSGVPTVLLMSASLDRFTMDMILPPDTNYNYRQWPNVFNPANAPVYHIPTVKLNRNSSDGDYRQIITQADAIISNRQELKGIIHTVSYERVGRILQHSIYKDRFIWHENGSGLQNALVRFRSSGNGILVTPSAEEGHDLPEADFQVVVKFPYPNEANFVTRQRCERIPGYRLHHAAQKLIQIRGRPIRSETAKAEMFILDNAVNALYIPSARGYLPSGFRIFTVNQVPEPIQHRKVS